MKLQFSISLKLTVIVVAVSALVIFTLTLYNINEQAISFDNIYVDKAKDAGRLFDIAFSSDYKEDNMNDLIHRINESEQIQRVDVFVEHEDHFQRMYSTNLNQSIRPMDSFINISIDNSAQVKIPQKTSTHYNLTVITPMNATSNRTGAYVLFFNLYESYQAFQMKTQNLVLISTVSLFVLIFSFLFLLRTSIVKPIIHFRDAAKTFGRGNLDSRVSISSNDELGELADAFNTMAHDLKQSREKIEEYNKILEQLLDQKDEFIGQLGHDLKNPLQSIVGLLPLLLENEQNPKMKEHLKVLNSDAQYMKELILKTLELAKLRSQNIEFDFTDLNLSEIVKKTVQSQHHFFDENNITIRNNVENDIVVVADGLRLEEVFKNLFTNAVKYTPDKGGSISISAEEDNEMITISIKDEGLGMTQEQLNQIFDEFYRAHSTTKGFGSLGLGLSISKRIIEQHGGRIWAESKGPGKGSTFKFTLKKGKTIFKSKSYQEMSC